MKPASERRIGLERVLRRAFALVALALYAVACLIIVAFQSRQVRSDLRYLLYSEAEGLAAYLAAGGGWDYPELVGEPGAETPEPVWLRVLLDPTGVIRETKGAPSVSLAASEQLEGALVVVRDSLGDRYGVVTHGVWNRPGLRVEAIARLEHLDSRGRRLLATLLLTGAILVPLAAVAGRLVAALILRPMDHLLTEIRAAEPEGLGRLAVQGPIAETAELAAAFNQLLERVGEVVGRMQRFTEDASHELRTPLANLRTSIEVTLRRPREAVEYQRLLAELLLEIDRLERVVEGLLALARERDWAPLGLQQHVALDEVVATAQRTVSALLATRRQRLEIDIDPDLAVTGDSSLLALMLINLLDNAIKHGPEGSSVSLDGHLDGEKVVLVVRDQGPGVPEADRPWVFERRFQGGVRSTRAGGIGLDLVRWVSQRHGGSVRLLDERRGAAFEITLPRAPT